MFTKYSFRGKLPVKFTITALFHRERTLLHISQDEIAFYELGEGHLWYLLFRSNLKV